MNQKYRSRLNALPLDLKIDIASVISQWGMSATRRRLQILEAFQDYKVPVTELGTGTNRLIVKYSNYALKMALDDEGVDDNRQEWVMSEMLDPGVAFSHEISGEITQKDEETYEITGGHLLVASYVPAFTSIGEMLVYGKAIRSLLKNWSTKFLLGDVGITKKNFANWGLDGNIPKCIDYAYIFPAGINLFNCTCGYEDLQIDTQTFSFYTCKRCGKKWSDSELRSRISNERRHEFFSQVKGIRMTKEYEVHDVDPKYLDIEKPRDTTPIELPNYHTETRIRNNCEW